MDWFRICLGILAGVAFIIFLTAYICYRRVFYSPARKIPDEDEFEFPEGKVYEPHYEKMREWMKMTRQMPHEDVSVTSFDGLILRGRYYEYEKGAPIELLFHGYKSNSERDLSGGVERCFSLGRNALLIDQRAGGRSDGHVISFGINERRDCLAWIDLATRRFGKDAKIIITGISMGAATVMMAAGELLLPENVVCVLADCGYTSPREIIEKVMRDMKLPPALLYPFVRLGARIFGKFDLEEASPIEAVKRAKVPIIFIHGDTDDFVPCEMSERLYEACTSPHKRLVKFSGAGHGLAYPVDKEAYLRAVRDFQNECGF